MVSHFTYDRGESCEHDADAHKHHDEMAQSCEAAPDRLVQDPPAVTAQPAALPIDAENKLAIPKDEGLLAVLPIPASRRAEAFLLEWLRRSNRG